VADSYGFTNDFQDLILACLVRHSDRFMVYGSVLKPKYFHGVHATIVARSALSHYTKFGKFPSFEVLGQLVAEASAKLGDIESKISDSRSSGEYVQKLSQLDTGDVDYVVSRVVEFAKERALISAAKDLVESLKTGKSPEGGVIKLFEQAVSVGTNVDDLGYVLHADYADVVRKVTSSTYGIKTGFNAFDSLWKNGWGPGWLIVPLAPPKRMKTMFAVNLALNMVGPEIGADVFYYPCEITAELATVRALANIAGNKGGLDYMYASPEKFIQEVKANMGNLIAGNLLMKGFAAGSATIADIKAHAKMAMRQLKLKPKAIFIDYAETIRSSCPAGTPAHLASASIYTEARAMGSELGVPIIMPDRCNKETTDRSVPSMTSFQGAFQKAGIVDIAIGLCGTDTEIKENKMRYFVFLNRHGKAFQHFTGSVDPEMMRMSVGEEIPYDPEEDKPASKEYRRSAIPEELQDGA